MVARDLTGIGHGKSSWGRGGIYRTTVQPRSATMGLPAGDQGQTIRDLPADHQRVERSLD